MIDNTILLCKVFIKLPTHSKQVRRNCDASKQTTVRPENT